MMPHDTIDVNNAHSVSTAPISGEAQHKTGVSGSKSSLDDDLAWMAERVQRLTITLEQLQRASRSVSGMSRHIRSLAGHTGIEAARQTNAPALHEISHRLSTLSEQASTLGHEIGRLLETHEAAINELQRIVTVHYQDNRLQELAQTEDSIVASPAPTPEGPAQEAVT